jgi:N-methylhydantoinase A
LPVLSRRPSGAAPSEGTRDVYVSAEQPAVPYALYTRENLLAGDEIAGPAVIAEHTATTVIHVGDHLRVGEHGEMVIKLQEVQ